MGESDVILDYKKLLQCAMSFSIVNTFLCNCDSLIEGPLQQCQAYFFRFGNSILDTFNIYVQNHSPPNVQNVYSPNLIE